MQKAAWYNMPIAVAVAKLWSDYTTLPMQVKSSFFWWQPDPTFLSLDASRILFPPQDRSAQRRGIFLTSSEDVPIEKYASIDLQALAPTVYELLKALNIDMIVVNKLMSDRMDTGDSAEDVACRWLKANQDIWESWMPDETKCFPQFGLYNEHTQQFVEDRTDPAGLTCRACDSGFYSNRIKDDRGITHDTLGVYALRSGNHAAFGCFFTMRPLPDRGVSRRVRKHELQALWPRQISRYEGTKSMQGMPCLHNNTGFGICICVGMWL